MSRALKVFQAHLGFYDTVVAAPSQAAALKAWGSRQNLFHGGLAKPADDPAAIAAATAKPGIVLRRPAGSTAAFRENPDLPQIPNVPKKGPAAQKKPVTAPRQHKPPPRAPRPPPDRTALDAAEKALADAKNEEERALNALAARRAALDREETQMRSDLRARREKAQSALSLARKAYQKATQKSGD